MFSKIFALFALLAVALAAPEPKAAPAPEPNPQLLAYTAGVDYVYPGVAPGVVSPYGVPLTYSAYAGAPLYLRR